MDFRIASRTDKKLRKIQVAGYLEGSRATLAATASNIVVNAETPGVICAERPCRCASQLGL
jgi:hypothetical protein